MSNSQDIKLIDQLVSKYTEANTEVSRIIVGQNQAVKQILSTIFVGGHALLIGVPGLAKTLLVIRYLRYLVFTLIVFNLRQT